MMYYYFTIAFVLLASFAVCGICSAYSPDLILKKSITVKNDTVRKLLKIESRDTDGQRNQDLEKVTVIGIILKLLWLIFAVISLIVLFVLDPVPITEEHKTALVMPALLTSFNQKLSHYINLTFLLFCCAICIFNSAKLLARPDGGAKRKAVTLIRIIWCVIALALLCVGVYIAIKCIQLFAYM